MAHEAQPTPAGTETVVTMTTGTHPLPACPQGQPEPPHVLDNPVWAALTGPHAHLAETAGRAARYPAEVSPFHGLADPDDPRAWADLAALAGPGNEVFVACMPDPPEGWEVVAGAQGVQMLGTSLRAEPAAEAVPLGPGDIPEMLELVSLTEPGPFAPRTAELGLYLGIHHEGRLIAMAGERLRAPGWTEISAVCTHPAHRGKGLAGRLIRAVAVGIRERGEMPYLHAAAANTGAIRLYESLGFTLRSHPTFRVLRTPA
jgi:ribosomal protein S18 acetylase RimI-like enzyme